MVGWEDINMRGWRSLYELDEDCGKWKWKSHSVLYDSLWPHGLHSPWNSSGQNTGVGSLSLLQGIFPTQGLNPCLLRCSRILYQLSHRGSPGILKWVAYPISQGSPWSRNQTGVSCIAGRLFTNWAIRWHALMTAVRVLCFMCTRFFEMDGQVWPLQTDCLIWLNSAALCLSFDIYKVRIIMLPIS